ncbi:MAG TPA: esterase-like activity of phytase family protein [Mycobacterium sp.]|jgi:glycerophosphoryl diester phosphodiesterase|nr:esterase-like activity of phytase family protein [Mycobacterium sp.]
MYRLVFAAAIVAATTLSVATAHASDASSTPTLAGRAVLPADTLALGPSSGNFVAPQGLVNGILIPRPSQPVEGFSSIVAGRSLGEYLAMPDNGWGGKANSVDFLIRAYYIRPDFKTAYGGSGAVDVNGWVDFRDPNHVIGFPIVNENTTDRLLTGGDMDPESLQRAANGDLWVGDEFGPWIMHFDASGVLLNPPYLNPLGVMSPNNPFLTGPATHRNSRGFEGMAISPDGRYLYPAFEGATNDDLATNPNRRWIFEFDTVTKSFTDTMWSYQTEAPTVDAPGERLLADMWSLDDHRMVLIERDGGKGPTANYRTVYVVDRRHVDHDGNLKKTAVVDLTAISDPHRISLPAIHDGDIGIGRTFSVVCESIEAIYPLPDSQLLLGCDNNLPNTGRNLSIADDNEFIVVTAPGLHDS